MTSLYEVSESIDELDAAFAVISIHTLDCLWGSQHLGLYDFPESERLRALGYITISQISRGRAGSVQLQQYIYD